MSKKMKHIWLLLCLVVLPFSVDAAPSLAELKALTNLIINIYSKTLVLDDYCDSLKVLKTSGNSSETVDQKTLLNAKAVTNSYAEEVSFDEIPPSKALPLLFALLENDELTDWQCSLMENEFNDSFGELVYQLIIGKMRISTKRDKKNIMMIWLPEKSAMWNSHDLTFFWYYAGLKHLPTLWNDWYAVWKLENKREKPRNDVLKRLANEIARQFSYHLYPFVAKAIEEGDTTLKPLLLELACRSYHESLLYHSISSKEIHEVKRPKDYPNFRDEESFLAWWNEYKDHFIIPPSDKKLSDIKNIFERKYPPRFFTKEMYESALKAEKALDEYCKRENRPLTNCWYFNIKEGDLEK